MATTPRPDPSSPAAVAGASFPSVRKGYDPAEVRSFLEAVSRELAEARDEVARLTRELDAAKGGDVPVLDEATAMSLLGEEAARVLRTAREGATAVQARAEEGAARLLREAQDEASRLRHEVELEGVQLRQAAADDAAAERDAATAAAARLRADATAEAERIRAEAHAEAEAEVADAKQQAREMLAETRAIRERMLSDLARRREAARQQLERLEAARDRIVEAFGAARGSLDDALAGVDDAFTVVEPAPARTATDDDADEALLASVEQAVAEEAPDDAGAEDVVTDTPETPDAAEAPGAVLAVVVGEAPVVDEPADAAERDVEADGAGDAAAGDAAVDDLFARLRAASTDGVAAQVRDAAEPEPTGEADTPITDEPTPLDPFSARAAALEPAASALARSLKRVLSDEQNDVLDRLRRHTRGLGLDALVGTVDEQAARYADVAREPLAAAARVGAAELGAEPLGEPVGVGAVTDDVVLPLRERLQRALDQAQGDTVEAASLLRAAYREWKTQRLEALAVDLAYGAAGRAAFEALPAGTPTCWLVDPSGAPCPDADDNALAGIVAAGEPFPTGHRFPPAHPGCRCLLARGDG